MYGLSPSPSVNDPPAAPAKRLPRRREFAFVPWLTLAQLKSPPGLRGGPMVTSLVSAIQRAGTSPFRYILLQRATEILGNP